MVSSVQAQVIVWSDFFSKQEWDTVDSRYLDFGYLE